MKKAIYFSLVALMFSVASFAQQNQQQQQNNKPQEPKVRTVEEIAKSRAERMRKQLLLGDDQYDKVYKLCLEQAKQDKARQEKMKAEKEAFAKDMKGILNEAQQERFEELQQPRHKAPNRFCPYQKGNFRPQNRQNKAIAMPQRFQAPQFQKAGEIRDPKLEMNRRRKMADDTKGPEQNAKPDTKVEQNAEEDVAALNFDGGVLSPYIIESVEADLLG